jgi:riboflavin kinase/FMN adenylyltransferase
MVVLFSLEERIGSLGPTAVAVGNFDGLHLGHLRILKTLTQEATARNLNSLVITFSPHPEKILGQEAIHMIQTLDQRLESLRLNGVDTALVIPFNDNFFRLTAEEFVRDILVGRLQAKLIVVGSDFRFGRQRQGNLEYLTQAGAELGFEVVVVPPVIMDGLIVSSSLIRGLLEKGQVEMANRYLGRPYEIAGRVIRGESRGQSLGIPTANIKTKNEILPAGVFITETQVKGSFFPSVTNIGNRPTFEASDSSIETHLLNFQGDLYGLDIKIRFHQKIREEKKFSDPQELRRQVLQDIEKARQFWVKG